MRVVYLPCGKTAYGVCRSARVSERRNPTGPTSRHVPPAADTPGTGSPVFTWPGTYFSGALSTGEHGRQGEERLFQQPCSRYFTINVKPLLFVSGNTRLRRHCLCCCHILICSPLWKTPASINFTFMVGTHNKWMRRLAVYQEPELVSTLEGLGEKQKGLKCCHKNYKDKYLDDTPRIQEFTLNWNWNSLFSYKRQSTLINISINK